MFGLWKWNTNIRNRNYDCFQRKKNHEFVHVLADVGVEWQQFDRCASVTVGTLDQHAGTALFILFVFFAWTNWLVHVYLYLAAVKYLQKIYLLIWLFLFFNCIVCPFLWISLPNFVVWRYWMWIATASPATSLLSWNIWQTFRCFRLRTGCFVQITSILTMSSYFWGLFEFIFLYCFFSGSLGLFICLIVCLWKRCLISVSTTSQVSFPVNLDSWSICKSVISCKYNSF